MKQPRVSVVMPVYNVEAYLQQSLDSLLAQTMADFEVICVDDCSTDRTPELLRSYEQQSSRVRCIFQRQNASAAQCRKDGVLASRGQYVMFVDGDDYLEPNALETALNAIETAGVDILQFGCTVENCANLPQSRIDYNQRALEPYTEGVIQGDLLTECFVNQTFSVTIWNKIFRGDLARRAMSCVEDGVFPKANDLYATFFLFREGSSFAGCAERIYHYCFGRGMTGHSVMTMENFQRNCQGYRVVEALERFAGTCPPEEAERLASFIQIIRRRFLNEQCGRWQSNLEPELRREGFFYMCQIWHMSVPQLFSVLGDVSHFNRMNLSTFFSGWPELAFTPRKIKTVALYYRCIANGGAQRVVAMLCNRFAQAMDGDRPRWRVVLVTDEGEAAPQDEYALDPRVERAYITSYHSSNCAGYPQRGLRWQEIIDTFQIDLVIDSMWIHNSSMWDMLCIKSHPSHPAFVFHSHSCCGMTYRMGNAPVEMWRYYAMADGVVTLSDSDRRYWSFVNPNTHFILNPCHLTAEANRRARPGREILWLGRISEEKRPLDMVRIMKQVVMQVPDALCRMVGDGDEELMEQLRAAISEAGLEEHIVLEGFHKDVAPFYENASAFIMTSQYEGFPLTPMEAAAHALPTVLYDLPWLAYYDLLDGWTSVPQRDVHQAAKALTDLLTDQTRWQSCSDRLYESFLRYQSFDIVSQWQDMISAIESGATPGLNPDAHYKVLFDQVLMFHQLGVGNAVVSYKERLKMAWSQKSEVYAKLRHTYEEKSEINAKLQRTYAEKSEINAKLQRTYQEKFDRGVEIKALKAELAQLRQEHETLMQQNRENTKALKQRKAELKRLKSSAAYKLSRILTWPVRKLRLLFGRRS